MLRFPAAAWTILVLLVAGVCAAGDGPGPAQTRRVVLCNLTPCRSSRNEISRRWNGWSGKRSAAACDG